MSTYWYVIPFLYLAFCILLWLGIRWVLFMIGAPRKTRKPIYGPADPYRRDGQHPRPNLRVVRP